jgi:hypothetical protein
MTSREISRPATLVVADNVKASMIVGSVFSAAHYWY